MNKILKVFTKEYKEDTKYLEFMKRQLEKMKLKSDNYDAEESISILKEIDSNTTSEKENMLVIKK